MEFKEEPLENGAYYLEVYKEYKKEDLEVKEEYKAKNIKIEMNVDWYKTNKMDNYKEKLMELKMKDLASKKIEMMENQSTVDIEIVKHEPIQDDQYSKFYHEVLEEEYLKVGKIISDKEKKLNLEEIHVESEAQLNNLQPYDRYKKTNSIYEDTEMEKGFRVEDIENSKRILLKMQKYINEWKISSVPRPVTSVKKDSVTTVNTVKKSKLIPPSTNNDKTYYSCDICDKSYLRKGNLIRHKMKIHSLVELPIKFNCKYCTMSFSQKSTLTGHLKSHSDSESKQIQCTMCNRKFAKPAHLNRHFQVHSANKAHICKICGNSFPIQLALAGHMRSHNKKKKQL